MSITESPARELERTGVFEHLIDIEARVAELEATFSELDSSDRAHYQAKQHDAREYLDRGQTERLVVIEKLQDGGRVLSKFEGIYTFVEPGGYTLAPGDDILAMIVDIGDNHAEAIAIDKLGGPGE